MKTDREDMHNGKTNMSDYFKPSTNRVADKRASEVFINNIHNEFQLSFLGIVCFGGTLT